MKNHPGAALFFFDGKKKKKAQLGPSTPSEALAHTALQDYLFEVASLHLSQVLGKVITSLLNWVLYALATLKSALTAALKCYRSPRSSLGETSCFEPHYWRKKKSKTVRKVQGDGSTICSRLNPDSSRLLVEL